MCHAALQDVFRSLTYRLGLQELWGDHETVRLLMLGLCKDDMQFRPEDWRFVHHESI